MNIKRLDGPSLNFWIAKAAGLQLATQPLEAASDAGPESGFWHPGSFSPASNWSHAGPIISNEWFAIEDMLIDWFGNDWATVSAVKDHPLTWFMRAYVATQYGNEVEDTVVG